MKNTLGILLMVFAIGPSAAQTPLVPSHEPRRAPAAADPVVARVNGTPIQRATLDAATNGLIPLNTYHRNVSPEKLAELRRQALDGLIDEELRHQDAVRLKIQVSAPEVEQGLERARKAYRGREEFERARRASGATLPQLRLSIRRALMIQKAYEQVVASACQVNEAGAAAYYRENRERFISPEQLRPYLITIGVDPSASKDEWERARRKAQDISRQVTDAASFERLARQHSADPSAKQGGDLGFVHRGRLIDEFESALKTLRPGQVSGVIQSIHGFHLIRLAETRPPIQKTFEEVKQQLIRDLTETRCADASAKWSHRLREAARIEIFLDLPRPQRVAGAH